MRGVISGDHVLQNIYSQPVDLGLDQGRQYSHLVVFECKTLQRRQEYRPTEWPIIMAKVVYTMPPLVSTHGIWA